MNDSTAPTGRVRATASPSQREENGLAQASFVLGIIGVAGIVIPPGLLVAPISGALAVVFGLLGHAKARHGAGGIDKAIVGIVLGVVAVLVSTVVLYLLRHLLIRVLHEITLQGRSANPTR